MYARYASAVALFSIAISLAPDAHGQGARSTANSQPAAPSADVDSNDLAVLPVELPLPTPAEVVKRLEDAELRIQTLEERLRSKDREGQEIKQTNADGDLRIGGLLGPDPEIAIAASMANQGAAADKFKDKKWYEKFGVRGYTQFRINEDVEDDDSAPAHHVGDRSVGDNQSFLIRRARLILSGDVHERLFVYLQPDFAVTTPGSSDGTHFTQIRDWYGDLYLSADKVHRLRVGQSKVPYGWENLQSSSNRVPYDRNDAFNSATRNERDLGVFYYYTPEWAQTFFKDVLDKGLKGSGNYGLFGIGAYNGQGGSLLEQNDNLHVAARATWPMCFDCGQIAEVGIQGYTGEYVVLSSQIRAQGAGAAIRPTGTLETGDNDGHLDERLGASFILYPQPIGLQAEWTVGRGPELNQAQTAVEEGSLYGGYVMLIYKIDDCCGTLIPFARWNYYQGGYKSERNAPSVDISDVEFGVEWQFNPAMELTLGYTLADRTNTTAFNQVGVVPYQQFEGSLFRLQFQINY
jgi:hypothetical protein